MEAKEALDLYIKNNIPLADIRIIFNNYFNINFDNAFTSKEEIDDEKINYILDLLLKGYPAVYIVGYDDIRGIRFYLNENVLIPRTETIEFIYDYVKNNLNLNNLKVLDLCTGSGFIALSLKKMFKDASIFASDISIDALEIARRNAEYNNLDINFIKSNFLDDIDDTFDIIISNPPYIEEDSLDVYAPFEPHIALYSGKDGLDSYRQIFKKLKSHLKENGKAYFEIESTNLNNTISLLHNIEPTIKNETYYDINNKPRYLLLSLN